MKTFRLAHRVRDAGRLALETVEASVIALDCSLSVQAVERALCGSVVHASTGATIERWLSEHGYLEPLALDPFASNMTRGITPPTCNIMPRGRAQHRGRT